ncbi:hypothetical protein CIH63_18045, partial [Salmonella enterica]|nr:hypothetical protein [Salmonella enterica]
MTIGHNTETGRLFSVAIGMDAATGENDGGVALGSGAKVMTGAANSVALGFNSTTDRELDVSVGGKGVTRTLSNLSDGSEANDAVNVRQLNTAKDDAVTAANKHTDTEITTLDGKAQGYANTAKDNAVTAAN